MAHTKGPWKSEIWPNRQMTILSDAPDLESPCLAVVWTPSTKTGVNMYSERDANARLIASAPELLSACKRGILALEEARRLACKRPVMETPLVTQIQCAGGAILAMQEAINKAEGR